MRVVLDAMGSDGAPDPEIEGAILASADPDLELTLVGDEERLKPALARRGAPSTISVIHASEVIQMHDSPVMAVRKKKDASLLVAIRLVKQGLADAAVSAGNTGAVMVAA
ncbi:MAG: phosphate acyltransferase, partial [Candidatus Hydrogenedentes bacterium]|nr:phosphate acyltransferase [Candidatus Hydrogenedentota bacterium]